MTEFAPRVNESNPDPRIACVLLLDTSGSMFGSPIEELNKGFGLFCQEIKDDELAAKRAEIAVITSTGWRAWRGRRRPCRLDARHPARGARTPAGYRHRRTRDQPLRTRPSRPVPQRRQGRRVPCNPPG